MAVTNANSASSKNIAQEIIGQESISRAQLIVVAIAMILNMLDGFDITAMAFTANSIGEQLQIPADQLGIVFSVALAGMMIGAMFLAPYSDIIGRRKMTILCVSVIGISMITTAFVTTFPQLMILRLITGLGVGAMLASLTALASEFAPEKYRSLAVVGVTAGYPLGGTVGGFIAAPIIPAYGWEAVFLTGGIATLAMLIAVYFFVPESLEFLAARRPKGALEAFNTILVKLGRPQVESLPDLETSPGSEKANVFGLLTKSRRSITLMLWLTFFFCFISLYFLISWIPQLVVNAGFTESQGVYAAVAMNGGGVIGIFTLGWFASRTSLSILIGGFLSFAAVTMILFALTDGISLLLIYLAVIGFTLQGGFTGLYAVAAKIYPTELRSTGVGWAIGLGRFGAVVGPYVGGVLIAGGVSMEISFLIFAIPLMTSGWLAFFLRVK